MILLDGEMGSRETLWTYVFHTFCDLNGLGDGKSAKNRRIQGHLSLDSAVRIGPDRELFGTLIDVYKGV